MNSSNHSDFQKFLSQVPSIVEAHRVSGEGCYWLRVALPSHEELTPLLENILHYGNYRVTISIGKLKLPAKHF